MGVSLHDQMGLQSHAIFAALCDARKNARSDAIHVIYGGGYDFNMWLSDLPYKDVEKLYKTGRCYFGAFVLAWRPGKYFRVTRRTDGAAILINDVVSFFQRTFVAACDEYLGDRFIERDLIVENKAKRGTFTHADQKTVDRYNTAELDNLVLLMTELRIRLDKVGLRPSRWDGPGAIAVALLKREGVKNAMAECPPAIAEAGRYAYAGGRFEVFQHGKHEGVYEYDVNSAYPTALQHVPDLSNGRWIECRNPEDEHTFGIYHVEYVAAPENFKRPQPLWTRSPKGAIYYGYNLRNWYWAPEVKAAQDYVARHGGTLHISEGYRFVPDAGAKSPFAFIPPMYAQRQVLKAAGDGAHVGIKLGLNSLYGKTCQRVGARFNLSNNTWNIPPYHQLEWAGYVTSYCRAMLLRAVLDRLDDVIAMETDAMFVRGEPLPVSEGKNLGEWEGSYFDELFYGQSGFYAGRNGDDTVIRTRGIDRGNLAFADLATPIEHGAILGAQLSRFVGAGLALQLNDWRRWRRWETVPKNVVMEPTGKRVHVPERCFRCVGLTEHHQTEVPMSIWNRTESSPYPIPWINPNPDMGELDEMSRHHLESMAHDYE